VRHPISLISSIAVSGARRRWLGGAIRDAAGVLGLAVLALLTPTAPAEADAISDQSEVVIEQLRDSYDLMQYIPQLDTIPTEAGPTIGWGAGTVMRGLTGAYEGTGRWSYLSDAMRYAEAGFPHRSDKLGYQDEIRNQPVKGWISEQYSNGDKFTWLVHAGNYLKSVSRLAYLVQSNPEAYGVWGHRVPDLLAEASEVITEFESLDWVQVDADHGYFKGLPFPTLPDQNLPWNMQHVMGSTYVNMYLATGDAQYQDKAQDMIRYFKDNITEYNKPDGTKLAEWNYATYAPDRLEDISHGGLSVDFAMAAHRAGLGFTDDDVERFAEVFRLMDAGSNGFYSQIDGTNSTSYPDYILSHTAYYWLPLAEKYPDIRQTYYDWFSSNYTTQPALQMISSAGLLMESERAFATELPVTGPPPPVDVSFQEDFSGPDMPVQWSRTQGPSPHTHSTVSFDSNGLTMTDLNSTATGNFWATESYFRPIHLAGDFSITASINWESINSDFQELMIRLWAEGADPETDNPLAEIGFADLTTKLGRQIAELGGASFDSGESSLGATGSALLTLDRSGNLLSLQWDGQELLNGNISETVGVIELGFGYRHFSTPGVSSFGVLGVSSLTVTGPSLVIEGDLDGDGFVGITDLNIVLSAWNQNVPPGSPPADPSGDGFVGIEDLNIVLGNWNAGTPPNNGANIPEPGTAPLLLLTGISMLRRHNRPAP
jgi:hypothetical protein